MIGPLLLVESQLFVQLSDRSPGRLQKRREYWNDDPVKLYFFIRRLEVSARTIGSQPERVPGTHELIYCFEGHGAIGGAGRAYDVAPGQLMLNPSGRLSVPAGGEPLVLYQILFAEDLFSPGVLMEREALYVLGLIKVQAKTRNTITLSRIGSERVRQLCDSMFDEFQNRFRGYSWAIRLKLIELLITVMRDRKFQMPINGLRSTINTRIQDVILYLNTDYMNPITVEDVLSFCPMSRSHFHAVFKQETGTTFGAYLQALRCRKAAELLTTTEMPIVRVADASGFSNLSHFYHCFKRHHGVAPRVYRAGGRPDGR